MDARNNRFPKDAEEKCQVPMAQCARGLIRSKRLEDLNCSALNRIQSTYKLILYSVRMTLIQNHVK